MTNQQKAVSLIQSIETGDMTPIGYINPRQYKQHNLMAADGLQGFGELMQHVPKGSAKAQVIRSFTDGDYVVLHTKYDFFGPKAGFDVFRFDGGQIVEHWDNLQPIAEKNPSGHTQFDGPTEVKDKDKTAANKALIKDFYENVFIGGQFNRMPEFFTGDQYIQHNTMIADGLSGLGKAMEEMGKHGMQMKLSKAHKILGEGNFVLVMAEGEIGGQPNTFYDLFRVENGKIAEHWDVIEALLPKDQWKNQNGKF
ncbi:nuclear transport factor 2 family protein [Spirosoma areae]